MCANISYANYWANERGIMLHNNSQDEVFFKSFELSGVISSDVWVSSPKMFPFWHDFLEIITATIRLDLASDHLRFQANFRFFTEDCQCTCHSGFLWNSCILQYAAALLQSKVVNDLEAGERKRYFFYSSCRGVGMLVNPLTAEGALTALIDFTLSNARRFYSSKGNPLDGKGLTTSKTMSQLTP